MKILLCEDVENVGFIGEVVTVKDGYARNYLLPFGKATVPTQENVRALAEAKAKAAEQRQLARKKLEHICEKVEGAEAVIAAKANEQGHLFGSVTEKDVAANLQEQGFEVSDKMVKLSDHIKEVGTQEVTIRLTADLTAKVNVVVVSQDGIVEPGDQENAETE
jgi:large subunit ribosomal protein L9